MKRLALNTALVLSLVYTSGFAQAYSTGFDTPADQTAWTEYRVGDVNSTNWNFPSVYNVSAPYSLYHDYPMGGATVEDWFVSPKLYFTGTKCRVTLYSRISAMSAPPSVYYGIWISYNAKNPSGGDYSELANLTLFPASQGTWADTLVSKPLSGDRGYLAIKYKADNYAWLMVWLDNISVDSASTTPFAGIDGVPDNNGITIGPNPTYGKFHITCKNMEAVSIFDYCGRLVFYSGQASERLFVNFSNQPKSVYFIIIKTKTGTITRKIVTL